MLDSIFALKMYFFRSLKCNSKVPEMKPFFLFLFKLNRKRRKSYLEQLLLVLNLHLGYMTLMVSWSDLDMADSHNLHKHQMYLYISMFI